MNDKKIFMIFGRKADDYKLLKKAIDTIVPICGKKFMLRDILLLDSLSWFEKKGLKKILGGDYNKILAHNIELACHDGMWIYENTDIVPHNTIRILNILQKENKFRVGPTFYLDDLALIEYLSEKVNEIFDKEMEETLGEKVEGFEIDQELLNYVSNDLRQKIGKTGKLDHLYVTERIIYSIGTGSIFLRISANYHGIQFKIGQFSEIICPPIRYKKNHGGKRPKYI